MPTVILILSGAYYLESINVDPIDKILIKPTCLLILLIYMYFVVVEFINYKKSKHVHVKVNESTEIEMNAVNNNAARKTHIPYKELAIIFMTALYVLAIQYLGFVFTSIVFMASMFYILNVRKVWIIAVFSIFSTILLYFAFKVVLMLPLPEGIFAF